MQFLNLVVLVVGVAGVFTHIGSRDNQLNQNTKEIEEIKGIAQDLLQTQITSASNDARLFESLESLKSRVSLLEKK
jgi:hypothetical protein